MKDLTQKRLLVGGGAVSFGSVKILDQIRSLNAFCIDFGICLEIFTNPSKRGRVFTVPDEFIE